MTEITNHPHNLLVTFSEERATELEAQGHTYLGVAEDPQAGGIKYVFLRNGGKLANNLVAVRKGMDGIEGTEDQSLLQSIAKNFELAVGILSDRTQTNPVERDNALALMHRSLRIMQDITRPETLTVKLHYFKPTSGKLYQEAEYETPMKEIFEVFSEIRAMRDAGELPGLTVGSTDWIIHIEVPGHEHAYPHILMPEAKA